MMDQAKSQIISNHDHNLLTFITVFNPTILRAMGWRVETAAATAAHQITFRSPSPQPSIQSIQSVD